jgi:hypothetical protein
MLPGRPNVLKRRPSATDGPATLSQLSHCGTGATTPTSRGTLARRQRPGPAARRSRDREYERAFSGRQAQLIVPQLQSYRIAVWLPDADGPVNLADSAHQALIMLKGR